MINSALDGTLKRVVHLDIQFHLYRLVVISWLILTSAAQRVCGKSVKIWQTPIATLPIKKRSNTVLFIDGKRELYIHKRKIKNFYSDLLERVVATSVQMSNVRMNTHKTAAY